MNMVARLGMGLCAMVLALGLAGCSRETPEGEVKRAIKALSSGNASTVVSLMTPERRKRYDDSTDEEKKAFREQIKKTSKEFKEEKKGVRKITILERNIDGSEATIRVEIEYRNGDVDTTSFRLEKFDNDWCLKPGFLF